MALLGSLGFYLLSLNDAALYFFTCSVPLTYAASYLFSVSVGSTKRRRLLLHGFRGGWRHIVLQALAWGLWGSALWLAALQLVDTSLSLAPVAPEALPGVCALLAAFAQLFMTSAGIVFRAELTTAAKPRIARAQSASHRYASAAVVVLGWFWVALGLGVIVASEFLPDERSRLLYYVFAMAALIVGTLTTHGLGGVLRYGRTGGSSTSGSPNVRAMAPAAGAAAGTLSGELNSGLGSSEQEGWSFFQPFRGGSLFVAVQAAGWALFALALVSFVWVMVHLAQGVAYCVRCWALATGATMVTCQLLLAASLLTFRGGVAATRKVAAASRQRWSDVWLPVIGLYIPVHAYVAFVALSCTLVHPPLALAFWATLHAARFVATAPGRPEHTGCHQSPAFRAWFAARLEPALAAWLGRFELLREGPPLDPGRKFIFGYHPHGLYPIGAAYLPMTPSWSRLLPGVEPVTLTASVVFFPPVIRDIALATGMRQVTRRTLHAALQERGSVLLVPGGQAESVHTWRTAARREWVAYTRHRGFVRAAIAEGACLVPIIAFGELDSLHNLVDVPSMLQWTYKRLGFPLPYLMVGRWGFTPFPAPTGLRFVVGQPLPPPPLKAGEIPSEAAVQALHRAYYNAVQALFLKYKDSFPGYRELQYVAI